MNAASRPDAPACRDSTCIGAPMGHRTAREPNWKPAPRPKPAHIDRKPPVDEQRQSLNWIYGLRDDERQARFVKTPNVLNFILPLDLAYFVGALMDWDRRKSDVANGGWFYFPTKWIAENFPFATRRVQERLFRELRARGYIQTKMQCGRGVNRRWIWIDYTVIQKACVAYLTTQFE